MAAMFRTLSTLVALVLLGQPARAQSGLTAVPGTAVRLIPPASFSPSGRFPGFQDLTTGSSIMVTEIPGPVAEVTAGMTEERLASGGMTLTSRTEVTVSGQSGLLLGVTQAARGVTYQKWLVVFGNASATVMVTATFPQDQAANASEPLRRAVLSTRWTPEASGEVNLEGLPFRVRPPAAFALASRVGNNVILTLGGEPIPRPPGEPFVVVGSAISPVDMPDLAAFARARVQQTASVTNITPRPGTDLTVAGHLAHELTATATDARGEPIVIYQAVVRSSDGYTLVQALLPAATAERLLPELRTLTRGLTFPG